MNEKDPCDKTKYNKIITMLCYVRLDLGVICVALDFFRPLSIKKTTTHEYIMIDGPIILKTEYVYMGNHVITSLFTFLFIYVFGWKFHIFRITPNIMLKVLPHLSIMRCFNI